MRNALGSVVVALVVGLVACGGNGATPDGGRGGAAGDGAGGGTTGAAGTTGTAGTSGAAAGRGGTTGTAGGGGTLGNRCTAPGDCSGSPPSGTTFCSSPTWSCLDGACLAECMGGRTCTEAPDSGCLLCRTSPTATPMSEGCVGTQCVFSFSQIRDMQQTSSCDASNTPNFETWHCTGRWAVLAGSGPTACTIQTIPTDAIRYSVSCGSCVTVVTLGSAP